MTASRASRLPARARPPFAPFAGALALLCASALAGCDVGRAVTSGPGVATAASTGGGGAGRGGGGGAGAGGGRGGAGGVAAGGADAGGGAGGGGAAGQAGSGAGGDPGSACGACDPGLSCDPVLGCVACRSSEECVLAAAPACVAGQCRECATSFDCHGGGACSPIDHTCGPSCGTDADCAEGGASHCDPDRHACVECTEDAPCAAGLRCALGRCVACMTSADCQAPTPACDVAAGVCVACVAAWDCPGGAACTAHTCADAG